MTVLTDHPLPNRTRLVHAWLPVVLALLIASAAGWSIMHVNEMSYRASQDRESARSIAGDLQGPVDLLTEGAKRQLESRFALPRDASAPASIVVYYAETLRRLDRLRASTGEPALVDDVSKSLRALATTQDALNSGAGASLVAARNGATVAVTLTTALSALEDRLTQRSRFQERLARGATMVLVLLAALSVIVLLRRFDRMRQRLTSELRVQATHDPLTGLANRRQLTRDLAQTLRAATVAEPSRLVFFDLDGFKSYNDTFGHPGGDLLLGRLGDELAAAAAASGSCYRLGGDEFCVLLPAERRRGRAPNRRGPLRGRRGFRVTCSLGSVLIPTEASDTGSRSGGRRAHVRRKARKASAGSRREPATRCSACRSPTGAPLRTGRDVWPSAVGGGSGSRGRARGPAGPPSCTTSGRSRSPSACCTSRQPRRSRVGDAPPACGVGANILASSPALTGVGTSSATPRAVRRRRLSRRARRLRHLARSRIVCVCDAFVAMVLDRPYRAQ